MKGSTMMLCDGPFLYDRFFPPQSSRQVPSFAKIHHHATLLYFSHPLMGQKTSKLKRARSTRSIFTGGSSQHSGSNRDTTSNGSHRGGSRYIDMKLQHDEFTASQGTTDYSEFEWMNNVTEESSYFLPSPGNDAENDRLTKQHIMLKAIFDG